jgi:hypothetical protein
MVFTKELRPVYPSALADLRQIPLAEMPALGLDALKSIGRLLRDASVNRMPVAAFQSSI